MVSPPLWSDDPLPHGHAARSASAAFSAQNASGSEYRQSRTSAMRMSRKSCLAERSLWAAEPHEGAGGQAVDTCRLSPVWNTAVFAATFVAAIPEQNRASRAAPSTWFCNSARFFLTCLFFRSRVRKTGSLEVHLRRSSGRHHKRICPISARDGISSRRRREVQALISR